MLDAVNVFAQSNEYDMIFADGVIYASSSVNITGLVIEALNKGNAQNETNQN